MAIHSTFAVRRLEVRKAEAERSVIRTNEPPRSFQYTFALARTYGGLVGEYKLDWFFLKGYAADSSNPGGIYKFSPHFARTLQEVNNAPDHSLSDHFPITVDIPLTEPQKVAQP